MKDEVLIVVGYDGGYGGSFFSNVLKRSLENESQELLPINDRNEFHFNNHVFDSVKYSIDLLADMYEKSSSFKFIDEFYQKKNDEEKSWLEFRKKIFMQCYDKDRSVFCENLTSYFSKTLRLNSGYNIASIHYSRKFDGFSIHNIHKNVVFFLLKASDLKSHVLFDLLFDIKLDHFIYPEFVRKSYMSLRKMRQPMPFDSCHSIDVDHLFLKTKDYRFDLVENVLSKALGKKISLDKEMIENYSRLNVKLLNDFLNIDVEQASYKEVMLAAEIKLELLLWK